MTTTPEPNLPPPEAFVAIQTMLDPVTVPIMVRYDGRIGPHATGLLFACGEHHFLITARHAVTDANRATADLLVPSDSQPDKAFVLPGKFFFSEDSRLDVAAIQIPVSFQEHFSRHRWARLTEFAATWPRSGIYCASFGILTSESETWAITDYKPPARLQRCIFLSTVTELSNLPEEWLPELHIAALGDLVGAREFDGGYRPLPASIKGLSGSPVAAFGADPYMTGFSPLPLRIIGFQSSVVPFNDGTGERVAKIVHWAAAIGMIASLFPTVREISQHYGLFRNKQ